MRRFRRCKHTWVAKAVQPYINKAWGIYAGEWYQSGDETTVYYVCSTCHIDKQRTVPGRFTLAQAKELFPKP